MKTLTLLAALALVSLTGPASADNGGGGCNGCAIQQPDQPAILQTPQDGGGGNCSGCALPTPAPQRLADKGGGCSGCDVEQSDTPVLPQTPADGSANCNGCALPTHPGQRAAFRPIIVADSGGCNGCKPPHCNCNTS